MIGYVIVQNSQMVWLQMITELEEEHARLLSEHDELSRQLTSLGGDVTPTLRDESKLREEKRILKQDTQRMDARMNILEVQGIGQA